MTKPARLAALALVGALAGALAWAYVTGDDAVRLVLVIFVMTVIVIWSTAVLIMSANRRREEREAEERATRDYPRRSRYVGRWDGQDKAPRRPPTERWDVKHKKAKGQAAQGSALRTLRGRARRLL